MARIALEKITKIYGQDLVAVDAVDLEVRDGEFMVLLGPSGCGKSTTLRMIAGLEEITSGELRIDGRLMNHVDPADRDLAIVFQNYALYPHMTVSGNLAFGLRLRKVEGAEIDRRIHRTAAMLGIDDLLRRRPRELSGGQQQRVALGRALVRDPVAFLFDEPLSNLDAKLRAAMRTELIKIHRELGRTIVHVTHDQVEAMTMGRRIAVMQSGRLQQVGAPVDVYRTPATTFVATFMGAPPMNLIDGELRADDGRWRFVREGYSLDVDPAVMGIGPGELEQAAGPVRLGVRPEHLTLAGPSGDGIPGTVQFLEPVGSDLFVSVGVGEHRVQVRMPPDARADRGDAVRVGFDPARSHIFGSDDRNLRTTAT